jgi:cell wall-associated NlpC family hydrolase
VAGVVRAQGAPVGAASSGAAPVSAEATKGAACTRLGEAPKARPFAGVSMAVAAFRDSLVSVARTHLGTPYVYGGTSPVLGLDCSALMQQILGALGIDLPRTANEQARTGREIAKDRKLLRPGDVLTFGSKRRITHIGLYVGEGKFIHASTSRREVIESSIDNRASSLVRQWRGVRRFVDSTFVDSLFGARPDSLALLLQELQTVLPPDGR